MTERDMTLLGWRGRAWQLPRTPSEGEEDYEWRIATAYFAEQVDENLEWWSRMGGAIGFDDQRVLDLGCGHGALAVDIARRGAAFVDGIDLDAGRIAFARRNVAQHHPDLANRIAFHSVDVTGFGASGTYDTIVTKDTVEHLDHPDRVFRTFARLLKPGGRLLAGFSPLYYSPFGDHMRLNWPVPWAHAILPVAWSLAWRNATTGRPPARALADLGLNGLTPAGFRALVAQPWWRVERMRVNQGGKPLLRVLDALRRVPGLEKYCTVSIYAVLTRV